MLELVEHWVIDGLDAIALQIVEECRAELSLIWALHNAEDWLEGLLLCRLQVVEEIGLNRWWKYEVCHE